MKSTTHIAWHPAFVGAIQLELEAYRDDLEFHPEYQLTTEPLKIDCVVIKKAKDVVITKNIAAMFRDVNLLEYKSPEDYVSIADFYKVYGYACLYASLEKVTITNLTLTFVESHYPRELLAHLKDVRGYTVEETSPGIYTVRGDILPIQIIDNRQLPMDENLWLKCLSNRLDPLMVIRVGEEAQPKVKDARIQAYMDVIAKANFHAIEEAINMSSPAKSLDEVFERTGLAARWEAKYLAMGEERKAVEVAKDLIALGLPFENIVSVSKLAPEKVEELYQG